MYLSFQMPRCDESPGQTKRDDAADNDVPIIDEDEFRELLGEYGITLE